MGRWIFSEVFEKYRILSFLFGQEVSDEKHWWNPAILELSRRCVISQVPSRTRLGAIYRMEREYSFNTRGKGKEEWTIKPFSRVTAAIFAISVNDESHTWGRFIGRSLSQWEPCGSIEEAGFTWIYIFQALIHLQKCRFRQPSIWCFGMWKKFYEFMWGTSKRVGNICDTSFEILSDTDVTNIEMSIFPNTKSGYNFHTYYFVPES